MTAVIEAVIGQNITVVYNAFDLQIIDRNKIREIIPGVPPTVMDTPEMLVAVYAPNPWVVQIGDRRIRVNIGGGTDGLGDVPVWEYAIKACELVPLDKSAVIAYGYNFDFVAQFQGATPNETLISKFLPDRHALEDTLQGELVSYLPRLTFKSGDTQYDIVFEPMTNSQMKVHGNVHFQYAEIDLPTLEGLKSSFIANYEHIRELVLKLLND